MQGKGSVLHTQPAYKYERMSKWMRSSEVNPGCP